MFQLGIQLGIQLAIRSDFRRRERAFDKFSRNTASIETKIKIGHDDVKRFEKVLFIIGH